MSRRRFVAAMLPLPGLALLSALPSGTHAAGGGSAAVEIRAYNLKPGTRARFHRIFLTEALPLLREHDIDVVAWGASLHDEDSYFLIRAFRDLDERRRLEDGFYGSAAWQNGPRDAVLSLIESYTTIVLPLDHSTVEALRVLTPEDVD